MSLETLRSSCSHYEGRRLWFGRTTLLSRLINVKGWRGVRRFRDRVRIDEVEAVSRVNGDEGANLTLHLKGGETRTMKVSAPGIWRMQIEYRLRRIGSALPPGEAKTEVLLPTADEVERSSADVTEEPESLDDVFFEELGPTPSFDREEEPAEVSTLTEVASGLGLEWPAEPIQHQPFALEPVALDEGEEIPVEKATELHEIGEDVVLDQAMDPSTSGSVVLDWLEPAGSEGSVPAEEAMLPSVEEPVDADAPRLPADPLSAPAAADTSAQEEAVPALPIASTPYQHSPVYRAAASSEEAETEERAAGEAPTVDVEPAAPSISVEAPARRTREPIRSLADLRPMSLAELIRESEPAWRSLAEIA